jgi:hypothetical protein
VGDRDADAILDALRAKPEGMTRTEIRRLDFQDHKSSDDVAQRKPSERLLPTTSTTGMPV